MVLEPECVGVPLAACVGHENIVPCFGCMIASRAPTIWFHVD